MGRSIVANTFHRSPAISLSPTSGEKAPPTICLTCAADCSIYTCKQPTGQNKTRRIEINKNKRVVFPDSLLRLFSLNKLLFYSRGRIKKFSQFLFTLFFGGDALFNFSFLTSILYFQMQFCKTNTNHLRRKNTTTNDLEKVLRECLYAIFYVFFILFWLFYLTLCLVYSLLRI